MVNLLTKDGKKKKSNVFHCWVCDRNFNKQSTFYSHIQGLYSAEPNSSMKKENNQSSTKTIFFLVFNLIYIKQSLKVIINIK